jgi:hypothetical protein
VTPSPLAAAVEVLLKDAEPAGFGWTGEEFWRVRGQGLQQVSQSVLDALRAALAADAAWRARAEAAGYQRGMEEAIKVARGTMITPPDADVSHNKQIGGRGLVMTPGDLRSLSICDRLEDRLSAARRRYEEAARNPRGREVVDG